MHWTALVPLKLGPERKSRLAGQLALAAREALADELAAHVLSVLKLSPAIARTIVLAPRPFAGAEWRQDEGRGLNNELAAAREELGLPLLVVHGDLPLLQASDIKALTDAAANSGAAFAPDRHGGGTNAVALARPVPFRFAFGPGSAAAHRAQAVELRTAGLALDIDTPEDIAAAQAAGWRYKN